MRVLVADDDPTSRLMLKSMVSNLGHECLMAKDGMSAWETISSTQVDVLLTDWMMPGVTGLELCRRIRTEVIDHYIYIVLVTGLAYPEQVLEGMGAGADDYLVKPAVPFSVQTRLVAAERVTALHRQVAEFRLQLEKANSELLGRSLTDPLTGLGNRRRMEEELAATHARAQRYGRSYGVVMFDIDHFKLYNDRYGHVAGDHALRLVAHCIAHTVRADESIYRDGGEEFLLLLPDCNIDAAAAAARRIRDSVCLMSIPHEARPTKPSVVTVSGGIACWTRASTQSVAMLVEQADQALFQAKQAGRNRLHVAGQFMDDTFEFGSVLT